MCASTTSHIHAHTHAHTYTYIHTGIHVRIHIHRHIHTYAVNDAVNVTQRDGHRFCEPLAMPEHNEFLESRLRSVCPLYCGDASGIGCLCIDGQTDRQTDRQKDRQTMTKTEP